MNWRTFVDSDNPVATALLAKMGYNDTERKELRAAYLRMILKLKKKFDDARIALIMSVADTYFVPDQEQDEVILKELREQYPEEGDAIMELMPAWKRWGYEEGIEEGMAKGKEEERIFIIRKLLSKGFTPEQVAESLELPMDQVNKFRDH
ncbi:hypothetical protein [Cohnella soli]|uniref:Transposase n=1 Tax=Cohnella soli TaxID=425005 RepID=A0ABW0I233_9BACL